MQASTIAVPRRSWILGLLLVAAAGRLYEIDAADIWVDEANLILTSARPPAELFAKLRMDSSPPLYYLLVQSWSALFGDGPVALRLPAAAAGIALVAATWWAGRELVSPAAGGWAAVYVALSPIQMFYSQQVRMYALLSLLALLSTVGLVRFLRDSRPRDFALWVFAAVLALYTHNFAFHLGIAHALLIGLSGEVRRRMAWWAGAGGIIAILYAPWIPFLLTQLENRDHYAWFLRYWNAWGMSGVILKSLQSFSPAGEFLTYQGIGSLPLWKGVPTAVVSALAAWGAWILARKSREQGLVNSLWPLVLLLAPAVSALALSNLVTPHYVPGRVDQMMFPAFALLVGSGLAGLQPPDIRIVLGVGIAVLGIHAKNGLFEQYEKDTLAGGDRALANALGEAWKPGDVIVTTSLSRGPIAYYLGRAGVDATFVSFPRESGDHLGAQNDDRLLADRPALMRAAVATLDEARSLAGYEGRVFVLWVHSPVNYPLRHDGLGDHGFTQIEALGRYRQYGTARVIDARVYRPRTARGD